MSRTSPPEDWVPNVELALWCKQLPVSASFEIECLRRQCDDQKLMMSMLISQIRSLGEEPVVKINGQSS